MQPFRSRTWAAADVGDRVQRISLTTWGRGSRSSVGTLLSGAQECEHGKDSAVIVGVGSEVELGEDAVNVGLDGLGAKG